MKGRVTGADWFYAIAALAMLATLVLNSRAQKVGLISWQNAALIGLAALIAVLSYAVTRLFQRRP